MKNIYLVGFMGTGKTAVGKLLAEQLHLSFVDMDAAIEAQEKMTIGDIFKMKGEPYFRQKEKDLVKALAAQQNLVVSCGGGTFADEQHISVLKASGIVFCFTASPEKIWERTRRLKSRPLLQVADPLARIRELLEARAPFYQRAHYMVDGDRSSVAQMAQAVRALLEKHG